MKSTPETEITNGGAAARRPRSFMRQYLAPLLYRSTEAIPEASKTQEITADKEFWEKSGALLMGGVTLRQFMVSDWFPRVPGLFNSRRAERARMTVWPSRVLQNKELGIFYEPSSKADLVEQGGLGSIRLQPRQIDGERCWLGTAITGGACHGGVPVAIPESVFLAAGLKWGDRADLKGQVRFLKDLGLDDIASHVHGARPLIVWVDKIDAAAAQKPVDFFMVDPVVLFRGDGENATPLQYAFVQCLPAPDTEVDLGIDWLRRYTARYEGTIITNFDEQRPILENAPLSYQRLITDKYDRDVAEEVGAASIIEKLAKAQALNIQIGGTHVGDKIIVNNSPNTNVKATLTNVTQTISAAPGLDQDQKAKLDSMVQSLKTELDALKSEHADEAAAIAEALQKAVDNASKPPEQRKTGLLQISANGLKEAAGLVADVAPKLMSTALLIANFVAALHGH